MKIAIATLEKNPDSEISTSAGRAPFYLIFNEKGEVLETWQNVFAKGGGGAGFAVTDAMKEKGVAVIIAGQFGQNMIGAMDSAGIRYMEKKGQAKESAQKIE
ncbi:MAG: NifB/NifX family molybdenum-iron cluster-binding protein [Patescibacteria group bacterium]|nr:NifB/NifX family molybdenum-iron cluster-binding protein [Patescibacteria group bacterium]